MCGWSMVQRRQMEALSRGIGKLWYCRECVDCVAVSVQLRFWCTQVIKPEEAWKPGCAFCLLSPLPRLCRLPLPQSPTVIPIPGNLLLLMECLDSVLPCRQPSRSRLRPTKTQCWFKRKICAPWLAFSRAKGRSAAELDKARVDGCVL